jgi:MarR family transcriptional regulator, transcriptional regulator for hemolysin
MEKRDLPLILETGKMMRELVRVLRKRTGERAEVKLTTEEFVLLNTIHKNEVDVIQKDMAYILGKDKSSILRLIDSLEEKDLVRRVADTNDRRKNYLMVTKNGEKELKEYLEIGFKLMEELKQGLTELEIATFYKVVNHIKTNSEKL